MAIKPQNQRLHLAKGMTVEVMTLENRVIFLGKIDQIQGGTIRIREIRDQPLPKVVYNSEVKLRCFQGSKLLIIEGNICGSTEEIWKVENLILKNVEERRSYFRQNVDLEAEAGHQRKDDRTACKVLDISAGGLLFQSRTAYEDGDKLVVANVQIVPEEKPFIFYCRVQRATPGERGTYLYGCQLEELPEREQDRLLRAIFIAQRKELQAKRGIEE